MKTLSVYITINYLSGDFLKLTNKLKTSYSLFTAATILSLVLSTIAMCVLKRLFASKYLESTEAHYFYVLKSFCSSICTHLMGSFIYAPCLKVDILFFTSKVGLNVIDLLIEWIHLRGDLLYFMCAIIFNIYLC